MINNCKLVYSDGIASVFDEKGEPSNLYAQALVYAEGNQEYAVELWSATQTEEYENEVGEENPDLPVVLRFLNNREDNPKTLSTEELKEVSLMMSDMGITNIEEFTTSMNKMFQPNGYYAVDSKKLLKSGMFSSTDISEMNHEAVKAFLDKLNYFNTHKNFNLTSTPNKNKVMLRNTTAKKTPLGSYPMVSEQELVEYIVDKSEDLSEQSIRKAIGQSPFAQLLDDKKAMKAITGMFQGKKKVNKMFFDGQEFTINNISTFVTLRNTLLAEADPLELEADLEFVESIPENIWKSKAKEVKNVLREIEQTALKYNIDIIGLNELSEDRASVLELLSALDDMLLSHSMENIQNFAQKKDSKIGMDNPYTVVSIKDSYRNYNIVKIDTNLSDDMMFQRGLLRVSSNGLYHVVQRTNTSEMYEAVYEMVMDNDLIIDSKYFAKDLNIKDPQYKEAVIDGITNYINSRDTGIESTLNEEISLFQTIFEHTPLNTVSPQEIESDPEYLKTGFVSDFYNYILQEKQANTDLYNKVLKYFAVTDADITLDALNTPDVTGIKFEQELRDYARAKKGGQIKSLNEYKTPSQDLLVINNPSLIKEEVVTNYVTGNDGYILSEPNPETYMRVGGKLYRKLFDKANGALYKEVITPTSPLYFDNNLNFDYNRQEAEAAHTKLSEALPKPTIKSAQSLAEQVGIPTMFTPIKYQVIGEQGASRMTEYKESLNRAKELEKEGKTPAQIEIETGWYKFKGDWRTIPKEVVESFQIKDKTVNKELTLKQVLGDDSTIFSFYPEISGAKVVFLGENYKDNAFEEAKKQTFGFVDEKTGTIYINMATTNPSTGVREDVNGFNQLKTLEQGVKNLIQNSAQKDSKETVEEVINKLKQTGLSSEVFQLNTTQLQEKLKELGVSDEIAMSVSRRFEQRGGTKGNKFVGKTKAEKALVLFNINSVFKKLVDNDVSTTLKVVEDYLDVSLPFSPTISELYYFNEILGNAVDNDSLNYSLIEEDRGVTEADIKALLKIVEDKIDKQEIQFQKSLSQQGINLIPNGFIYKDQVFLNTDTMTPDLIFHEFQHLLFNWAKEARPDIYSKGLELARKELKKGLSLSSVEETAKALEEVAADKFSLEEEELTPTARDVDYGNITWHQSGLSSFNQGVDGKTYITDKYDSIYQISKTKLSANNTFLVIVKDTKGNEVGSFEFKKNEDGSFSAEEAFTSKKGRGIAAIAYDFASKDGEAIKPSKKLKQDGVRFWSKSISEVYHKAKADGSNPELIKVVEELIGKSEIQDVIDYIRTTQPNLKGEALENEIITEFIGRYSKQMMDEQKAKSPLMQFLQDFWESVKQMLGITEMTPAQVANLTLEEYAKASVVSLSGRENFVGEQGKKNFKRWKGDNELVKGSAIQDVKTGQPIVAEVYHGTTNEFYTFDASVKGNIEGHLGKVNYFTSDYQDASENYLSEGTDLTNRLEKREDEIRNEIYDNEWVDLEGELNYSEISNNFNIEQTIIEGKEIDEVISEISNAELKGNSEQILEVYVKLNNPVVLGSGATWFDAIEIDEVYLQEATEEIAEEYDISEDEAKDEYDYEIRDRALEKQGDGNKILDALETALSENGYDYGKAAEILEDSYYEQEVDLNQIESSIRTSELYDNEDGELAASQVIADLFKNLGFDGIILTDVSKRFKGMGLGDSASHIHVFDEFNNQIKLSDGSNVTFNETPDIRYQKIVYDARVASQSKTMQGISDVDLVINNVYPKSQESDIKDKFDECRI